MMNAYDMDIASDLTVEQERLVDKRFAEVVVLGARAGLGVEDIVALIAAELNTSEILEYVQNRLSGRVQ